MNNFNEVFSAKEQKQLEHIFSKLVPTAYDKFVKNPNSYINLTEFLDKVKEVQSFLAAVDPTLNRYLGYFSNMEKLHRNNAAQNLERCFNNIEIDDVTQKTEE